MQTIIFDEECFDIYLFDYIHLRASYYDRINSYLDLDIENESKHDTRNL